MTAISLPPWTIRSYTVHLVTPAFLGNAEQRGAWRTPPFKALLRHWWRVAIAQKYHYDYQPLRQAEGELFGHAWLNPPDNSNKTWAMRSAGRQGSERLLSSYYRQSRQDLAPWLRLGARDSPQQASPLS